MLCLPYPEFVLTGVLSIKKALKGTETVFVLTKVYYNLLPRKKTIFHNLSKHGIISLYFKIQRKHVTQITLRQGLSYEPRPPGGQIEFTIVHRTKYSPVANYTRLPTCTLSTVCISTACIPDTSIFALAT